MKTSPNGIAFIKKEEGCVLKPYKDQTGTWTIGIGSTYLMDGSRVNANTPPLTLKQAEDLLVKKLKQYESPLNVRLIKLNQNQYDACVSLCYNIGVAALQKSKLYSALILKNPITQDMFAKFNKSKGQILPGLTNRRAREWKLFNTL